MEQLQDVDTEVQPRGLLRNPHVQSVLASSAWRRWRFRERHRELERRSEERILDCGEGTKLQGFHARQSVREIPRGLVVLLTLLIQLMLGAFTAGLDAGYVSNTWPLMNDHVVPEGIEWLGSLWATVSSDPYLVHFLHRWWAWVAAVALMSDPQPAMASTAIATRRRPRTSPSRPPMAATTEATSQ